MPVLLCDLDETLLDRTATFRQWAAAFVTEHSLEPSEVERLVGFDEGGYRPREQFVAAVNERYGPTVPLTVADFLRTFTPLFRCADPVAAALRRARSAGWKIAVVTNGGPTQLDKVTHSRLGGYVDTVCVSSIEGHAKPDPTLLRIAADRVRGSLDGAWMIGDSAENDIGAAVAAGIRSVWLSLGRRWPDLGYQPTAIAETFTSSIDLVLNLDVFAETLPVELSRGRSRGERSPRL